MPDGLMATDFDRYIERRSSDSLKWQRYGDGVLPMWVADMDFLSPEPVLEALRERVEHGVFGYNLSPPPLLETICERLSTLYRWQVLPEEIVFLPGLVCGLNLACRAIGQPGDEVLVQTPVYPPFLSAPLHQQRRLNAVELVACDRAGNWYYEIDYDGFAKALGQQTRLFLLCHPHNPVGRVYTQQELIRLAELCASHDVVICSDEIHCDLLLHGACHHPLAALDREIAQRCITLMAPSKTFNLASLGMSFAIIQNPQLRQQFTHAAAGLVPHVNPLGFSAALAAYRYSDSWVRELLSYLSANYDYLAAYLKQHMPIIKMASAQATYLAWLDCRQAVSGNPHEFFLRRAKVALNDGVTFGPGGKGFVRLNFGCSQATLQEGLEKMQRALMASDDI